MPKTLKVLKKNWYDEGVPFKCTSCGKCCTGKGGIVSLTESEAQNIAQFLKMSFKKFMTLYCTKQMGKYILKDDPGTDNCIFLKENKCSIYENRPLQCKTFPYWPSIMRSKENWDEEAKCCEGINHPDANLVKLDVIQENLNLMENR